MKKVYSLILFVLAANWLAAQTPFFTPTTYRGAFAPAPTPMWTDGWTEWDPQAKVYPSPTVDVTSDITTNSTWTSNNVYHLKGVIYVKNGATLTIQPGTVIMGDKNTPNSSLIVTMGSKLNAAGTASAPIVFTSDQAAGSKNLGDWGGIILLGKATNNNPGDTGNVEGLAPTNDTKYGGGASPDDNDNSGVLQYVRIEFGGYIFQPNKEINGLTLGSVGRGTTIDHIQVSFSNDDSYEWFGGTVNCKYLIAYRGLDDDFDTDNGYSGYVQFGLSVRDPQIADNPSVSTSEGFESDNDPNGTTAAPQTKAVFCNMTIIGPYRGNPLSTVATGYRRGARIRRNSSLRILNSVFMDHVRGIHIDGTLSEGNATNDSLKFKYNVVAGNSTGLVCEVNSGSTFNIRSWFGAYNDSLSSTTGLLTTPYNYTAPDYRPASGSPLLSGANFSDPLFLGLMGSFPIASFLHTQSTVPGSRSVSFNNSSNEKSLSTKYRWDFGVSTSTNDTSSAKYPTFDYPADGSYTVKLIATNAFGSDSVSRTIAVTASATNPFFVKTSYRGAFAPAPVAMWTDNWTEWDPQNKSYAATTVEVTTDITANTTWTTSNVYHLKGVIYVKNGATLTIQPGTVIRGDKTTPNSSLVITKGSKINAAGTSAQPIVFTSDQAAGSRNLGDWGGIIILGKASNNNPGDTANIEGLAPTPDTQYGGGLTPDEKDNSGVMQYVRIEFGGYIFQPNKEINGLTLGSVGSGTTIDHIQVSFSNDDSYEWFGGTVNCKYLIAYRGLDDDFDTDNGYSGLIQFALSVRDPQIADNPTVSTSEGFESDNDPNGTTANPQTRAIFSNVTIIGPYRGTIGSTIATGYRRAARIRRNSALRIFNSVFMDHPRGIHIDGALSEANATNDVLKFKNNILAGNSTGLVCEVNSGSTFNIRSWFGASKNDSVASTTGILTTPYSYTAPDYRPASSSIALTGADFTDASFTGLTGSAPSASFVYTQSTVPGSRQFSFNNSTNERGYITSYKWDFGVTTSTTDTSTAKYPTYSYAADGNYTITLYATNIFGTDSIVKSISVFATAVNPFFIPTNYRGAFAPAPNAMWTDRWTEWDPQNKVYPTASVDVTTDITANTTWTSNNVYHLKGVIYVKNGATLTIQPGTVIRGDKTTPNSSLIITKGSKINAAGTVNQPIVFTSDQDAGSRNLGDWGGIILLGKASNNNPGDTANIEGLAPSPDTQYGGGLNPDDKDNSGVMQYVRIEFGGYIFQPNKEINGLTLGSVGSGTTIDHIQVSFSNDDSYEWFGGTVNCKYLVAYRGLDDDFDTDNGYSGLIQFALSVRDPQIADNPTVSTSEGFESDNDPNGTTANPQTRAIFSNVTIIGPYRGNTGSTIATGYRRAVRIRRNSALRIFNSIFMDHQRGIHIDGALSEANATNDVLKFKNNILAGNSTGLVCEVNSGSTFNIRSWFGTSKNDSVTSSAGILTTPYNYTAPDYRPANASPALNGADYFDNAFTGLIATVQKPLADFSFAQDTAKGSMKVAFTNSSSENNNTVVYAWDFGVGAISSDTSSSKNPEYTYTSPGTYQVRLIVYSSVGNDTITKSVTVIKTGVGVNEVVASISDVNVYPNPAANEVNVSFNLNKSGQVKIIIMDVTGKVVMITEDDNHMNIGRHILSADLNSIQNGLYFISIQTDETIQTKRLLISH